MRDITDTFALSTNLPFAGSSLTDTLTPPFASGVYNSVDRGVDGLTATANPNIGPRYNNASRQVIEWWMQTLNNAGRETTGLVTITFQAQLLGVDLQGNPVWPDQLASEQERNYAYLVWNTEDTRAYTYTVHTNNDFSWVRSYVGQPSLSIDKDSTPPSGSIVGAGTPITYTLTVNNAGHTPAYDIVISDVLPSDVVYQGYTMSSSAGSGPPTVVSEPSVGATGTIVWEIDQLNGTDASPTGSKALTLTVYARVDDEIGASRVLTNTAYVPYYDSQPDDGPQMGLTPTQRTYNDGSDDVTQYTPTPDILKQVSKNQATIGESFVYTVTIPSPAITVTLYNVTLTDVVDSRLLVNGASVSGGNNGQAFISGNTVTATWTSILSQTQAYLVIDVTVRNLAGTNAGDIVPDQASFTWEDDIGSAHGPRDSNQVQTLIVEPDVYITKTAQSSPTIPGGTVTYTLQFGNATGTNNSTAYDVLVSDVLSDGLTYGGVLPGTPAPASVSGSGPTSITWPTISSMAPGDSFTYQFTATINSDVDYGVTLNNTGYVWGSSMPGDTSTYPEERNGDNASSNPRYLEDDEAPVSTGGAIGDYVWFDTNGDAVQDATEVGLSGVVITLTGSSGLVLTRTTDANGLYLFDGLPLDETYTTTVDLSTLPAGTSLTTPGSYTTLLTEANPVDLTHDYGVNGTGYIGDTVWFDYNGNGIQDSGEPGLAGVVITMTDDHGGLHSETTNSDGHYMFTGLLLDTTYTTTVDMSTLPPGTTLTTPGSFSSTLTGNNPFDLDHDYGVWGPGEVGDRVWHDEDGDALQDALEAGLPGVVVTLTSSSGLEVTDTTVGDGLYLFSHLLLDTTYTVTVSDVPGYFLTTPGAQSTYLTYDEPTDYTLDFGLDAELDCTKTRPDGRIVATWNFWYYIFITNTATTPAVGLVVTDTLPEGIRPYSVQASPGGSFDGVDTVVWHLGTLGPGYSTHVWVKAQTYRDVAGTTITNTAWVDSDALGVPVPAREVGYIYPPPNETPVPTSTATATPTPTPSGDVIVSGLVYDAALGPAAPIAGATVSALSCQSRRFQTMSGADGHYSLLLPGMYINQCTDITLEVWADGYQSVSDTVVVADLRTQSERDFALTRELGDTPTPTTTASCTPSPTQTTQTSFGLYLPLIIK